MKRASRLYCVISFCSIFATNKDISEDCDIDDEVGEMMRDDLNQDFTNHSLTALLSQADDEDDDDEPIAIVHAAPIVLPQHRRCAAHTLNLVAETADKFLVSQAAHQNASRRMKEFARSFSTAFAKCNGLWHRQRRSTPVSVPTSLAQTV